jgi:hypothetical protein
MRKTGAITAPKWSNQNRLRIGTYQIKSSGTTKAAYGSSAAFTGAVTVATPL